MFLEKIHPLSFFLAFAIGLLFCYLTNPKPDLVLKFPSPYNAGKITYKDNAEGCYKYRAEKVSCPADAKMVKDQPIAEELTMRGSENLISN